MVIDVIEFIARKESDIKEEIKQEKQKEIEHNPMAAKYNDEALKENF